MSTPQHVKIRNPKHGTSDRFAGKTATVIMRGMNGDYGIVLGRRRNLLGRDVEAWLTPDRIIEVTQ